MRIDILPVSFAIQLVYILYFKIIQTLKKIIENLFITRFSYILKA